MFLSVASRQLALLLAPRWGICWLATLLAIICLSIWYRRAKSGKTKFTVEFLTLWLGPTGIIHVLTEVFGDSLQSVKSSALPPIPFRLDQSVSPPSMGLAFLFAIVFLTVVACGGLALWLGAFCSAFKLTPRGESWSHNLTIALRFPLDGPKVFIEKLEKRFAEFEAFRKSVGGSLNAMMARLCSNGWKGDQTSLAEADQATSRSDIFSFVASQAQNYQEMIDRLVRLDGVHMRLCLYRTSSSIKQNLKLIFSPPATDAFEKPEATIPIKNSLAGLCVIKRAQVEHERSANSRSGKRVDVAPGTYRMGVPLLPLPTRGHDDSDPGKAVDGEAPVWGVLALDISPSNAVTPELQAACSSMIINFADRIDTAYDFLHKHAGAILDSDGPHPGALQAPKPPNSPK